MGQATFSANGNYKIDVDAALVSQSGLTSRIYWRVLVIKSNTSGHAGWGNNGSSGWADSSQGGNNDLWYNGNLQYNFQNGSYSGTFTMAEGYFEVGHRADGNAEYYVSGGLTLTNLGSASAGTGWRSLPRIQTATVPAAPTPVGFSDITQNQIRYLFSGNSDGGSPIREWQALWQDVTINGPQNAYGSNGSTLLGPGLTPGHTYNFWSRGRNDIGWGPWSNVSTAKTLAGARIKVNGVWKEAVPWIKVNGVWRLAQPYVKKDGSWHRTP
jgi:hypothetical protein